MGEKKQPPSLEDLGERLRVAREHREAGRRSDNSLSGDASGFSGLGWALRVGVEMVSALVVGVGIGLALDWWLDTGPWFLVVFFLLGAGAAMMNVYRAAMGYGLAVGYRKPEHDGSAEAEATESDLGGDSRNGGAGNGDANRHPGGTEGER